MENSRTVMIPKAKKPEAREHRPIALTNVGYKIFMGLIKDKIVEYLRRRSDQENEYQSGFTGGRRLEENLFMLHYCVETSYKRREQLIVIAIDFAKAFDSVNRVALLGALTAYGCDPAMIDVVVKLYTNDYTEIYKVDVKIGQMEVQNGIWQGCTGSPQLFVLIVNTIIRAITACTLGYRDNEFYIPALFFADDGLLLARRVWIGDKHTEEQLHYFQQCGGGDWKVP